MNRLQRLSSAVGYLPSNAKAEWVLLKQDISYFRAAASAIRSGGKSDLWGTLKTVFKLISKELKTLRANLKDFKIAGSNLYSRPVHTTITAAKIGLKVTNASIFGALSNPAPGVGPTMALVELNNCIKAAKNQGVHLSRYDSSAFAGFAACTWGPFGQGLLTSPATFLAGFAIGAVAARASYFIVPRRSISAHTI